MEKLAFLFTGQGAQFVGMGKSLYDGYSIAKQTYEEANDVLGFDIAKMCFEGRLADLTRTENTQPAMVITSVATFRVYMKEIGVPPQFCAGHSLGEYAALTCAGAVRFSDALKLIRMRGLLSKEILESEIGSMTIIDKIDRETVEAECKRVTTDEKFAMINCYNSPSQYAIAGHKDLVEQVEAALLDANGQVTPLIASAPFHCPLMEHIAEKIKEELKKYTFFQFRYPVISNVTGLPYRDPERIPELLSLQIARPVQWQATMQYLKKFGVTAAVEMGPKNVLTNLVKANVSSIEPYCYGQKEDRKDLQELIGANPSLQKDKFTIVTKCLAAAVATPNKNWDNDEYRKGVTEPNKRIQQIQDEIEKEGSAPNKEQMMEALNLLKTIFITKKLPVSEQTEWFYQMLDETCTCYELSDFNMPELKD